MGSISLKLNMKKKYFTIGIWQCVMDSCSLINVEHDMGIKELESRKGAILIPPQVAYEVAFHPKVFKTDPLRRFVEKYPEIITQFQNNEENEYLRIASQQGIHPGEAAAMTIALKRNLPLVIDEKDTKAKGKANNHGIKTLSWEDFLKEKYVK
jgi:predicted nucleic acid-binding protein